MSTLRKRIVGVLAATILATSLISITQPSTALAAGCRGSSCNGLDAEDAFCGGDARMLESFWRSNVLVQLRYSPSCNSAWARGISYNARNCSGWLDEDLLYIEGTLNGRTVRYSSQCMNNQPGVWFRTPMVSFTFWTRACLVIWPAFGDRPYYNGCTRWR